MNRSLPDNFGCLTGWRVILVAPLVFLLAFSTANAAESIQETASFGQASMSFDGEKLTVTTGTVSRQWKLTTQGLSTVALRHKGTDLGSYSDATERKCDWNLGNLGIANLVSLSAEEDDDESFTSAHLRIVAEFAYAETRLKVRYVVWVYPGASGFRTQLQLKALPGFSKADVPLAPQVVESIEIPKAMSNRVAFGLMQGIKTDQNKKILREERLPNHPATINWANGMQCHDNDRGFFLVKESNKHTALSKQDDVATGGFVVGQSYLSVTGAGLTSEDLRESEYLTCWATWLVLYRGGESQGNLALKTFDRRRYPIDPARDIYIMANTWGTEDMRPPCLHAAREENVLNELESVADLGIDVLQIDDGWQTPKWSPAASAKHVQRGQGALEAFGDYSVYPEGWTKVRIKAERLGVTLGLWAAWTAPTDALQANYDRGDFKYFKLDFARLNTKQRIDDLAQKARNLIKHSDYSARVNWDVTETAARMGYFCGREYGNIYLANRKTRTVRAPVLYVPYKVLNEAWNLSKYLNLNKFQVTVQNVDNVLADAATDAKEHGHDYAVGIALMSSPIFFQETRHYDSDARQQIRDILSVYKRHRQAMYEGYVFPIGEEPDNCSMTGFQNHNPDSGDGYLTIFRERRSKSPSGMFRLSFVEGTKLEVTDLLTGAVSEMSVNADGEIEVRLDHAPGFLFLRYRKT